jgi:hypothetical protein
MTDRQFEQLLIALQGLKPQILGFCPSPMRRKLYANLQYNCPLYFWNGGTQKHEPTEHPAIACIIQAIAVEPGEHKGKPNNKVIIDVAADAPYRLVIGIDTLTAKSLLLGLVQVDFTQPVTFAFRSGDEENALFCDVWQGGDRFGSGDRPLKQITESDVLGLIDQIQLKLTAPTIDRPVLPTLPSPTAPDPMVKDRPEPIADPLTGQTTLIPEEGPIVDALNSAIRTIRSPYDASMVRQSIESRRNVLGEAIYGGVMARYQQRDATLDYAAAIGELVGALHWEQSQAADQLEAWFGVRSRSQLSAMQLRDCHDRLLAMKSAPDRVLQEAA